MNDEEHTPFFSIIVPVYNAEDYVDECIKSVLSQSIDDYELILIDDGSTDRSGDICKEYTSRYNNVRLITKENGGASSARNCGIKNANGQFLLFLDSDDFWCTKHCLEILKNAAKKEYDIVMFKAVKFFNNKIVDSYGDYDLGIVNTLTSGEVMYYLIKEHKQLASACNKMIKRDYLLGNKIFFPEGITGEDIEWSVRLLKKDPNICAVNDVLYMYRQNRKDSVTNTISPQKIFAFFNMIKGIADEYKYGNEPFDNAVKSFMAFEYAILLYTYPICNSSISISDIKEYDWLFQYAIDRKSKIIRAFYKIFGYEILFHIIKTLRKMR